MAAGRARFWSGDVHMSLRQFDVSGAEVVDDATEEVIRKGDSRRSLVGYRRDGSAIFIHARMNMALLRAAASHPIVLVKPVSRKDEVLAKDGLLKPQGSIRSYTLLERLCADLAAAACP